MSTILITGIHGFMGNNLVTFLKINHIIYGLDIVSPKLEGVLETFGCNELSKIPMVDLIIHLAGKSHDTNNQTNEHIYFDINSGLTQQIFDWFATSKTKQFIFFSSVKAVADRVIGYQLTEDDIPNPHTPFGKSKREAEKYILNQLLLTNKKGLHPPSLHDSWPREQRKPKPLV